MELEGRFTSSESLAEIIRTAGREGVTGNLTIFCGNNPTELMFQLGRLVGSGNRGRQRKLGQIFLSRGLVDRAALEEALAYQNDFAPGTPLGKVLVFRGRITPEALRDAINLQIEEELTDLLVHEEGTYQLLEKDPRGADEPLTELDPTEQVNMVLARRAEWMQLRTRIPKDNYIPAVMRISDQGDREVLDFSEAEWNILSLINGYYDISCIAARSGLGRFETYRFLSNFLSMGIIELRTPRDPAVETIDEAAAQETPEGGQGHGNSSSWSGILSRVRDPDAEADGGAEGSAAHRSFKSPVSFIAAMANSILFKLISNPDFIVDPGDERLAERYWRQILMSFPRADLVTAQGNMLDAGSFDRYIETLGVQGAMKSIYLETVDGLNRYLHTLYLLSSQRLGSKTARSVFINGMENMRERSVIDNGDSFFFKEFAAKVIE